MKPVKPVENIYAALWKSVVTEAVAGQLGLKDNAAGIDIDHPMLAGTDLYCEAFASGKTLQAPGGNGRQLHDDDPEVAAYLAQCAHRIGHANSVGDAQLQADLQKQLARFKFGNPLWQQMSQQYFDYYAQYPFHTGGQPHYRSWKAPDGGNGSLAYSVIEWRLPADATVALIGDIGTGTDTAAAVLLAALSFKPDVILHVGDVYFSGTNFEFKRRFLGLIETVLKSIGKRVPIYTVPGNHEYFSGNIAYFNCLDSCALTPLPSQRQLASYFCLRSADDGWQFLGMDTGYNGHYLAINADQQQVALRLLHGKDPRVPANEPPQQNPVPNDTVVLRDDEAQWHRDKIEQFRGQSILLSHHPLYSAAIPCGTPQRTIQSAGRKPVPDGSDINREWIDTDMWRQLGPYFGERVPAWFWGHEHNLNIFKNDYRPSDWPANREMADVFRTLPVGRCIGHSAIPVQEKEAPYAKKFPVPLKNDSLRLGLTEGWYNHGFEIVQLGGARRPAHVSYFEIVLADPKPHLMYEENIGGS